MKYYAIKRPDGSWIMDSLSKMSDQAWLNALTFRERMPVFSWKTWMADAESAGYRCCEVSGFVEVDNG